MKKLIGNYYNGNSKANRIELLGKGVALSSVISFGFITSLARLAYNDGVTAITLIMIRFLSAAFLFTLACLYLKKPIKIDHQTWPLSVISTLTWFVATGSYLLSVYFIPVGLAALIYFTFPIIINVQTMIKSKRTVGKKEWVSPFLAFGGLASAIGPSLDQLHPTGIFLAALGAASTAELYLLTRRLICKNDLLTVLVHINGGSAVLIIIMGIILGNLALPICKDGTYLGWIGMTGASIAYPLAAFLLFRAISMTGPAKTSMLFNLEPLISITAASLILSERLTVIQLIGGAIVIGAIFLSDQPAT